MKKKLLTKLKIRHIKKRKSAIIALKKLTFSKKNKEVLVSKMETFKMFCLLLHKKLVKKNCSCVF